MPHYPHGLPAIYHQLVGLTPLDYVAMGLGKLMGFKDVLVLFKISICLQYLILLLGTYLTSCLLFKRKSTIFIVCAGVIACMYWYWHIFFLFRMYYMFPLALFCFLQFIWHKKSEFFWLTGIVFLAWVIGNPLYFICLWCFLFLIILIVAFIQDRSLFKPLLRLSKYDLLWMSLCVLLSVCFLYQLKLFSHYFDILHRAQGVGNSLGFFITYGGKPLTLERLIRATLVNTGDSALYVGILPLIFFVWALIKVRSKEFALFCVPLLALCWLGFAGIFAVFCYFIPGMHFYRHIQYLFGLDRVLLVLCAGYGIEHFWASGRKQRIVLLILIIAVFVFLADGFSISSRYLADLSLAEQPAKELLGQLSLAHILVRYLVYGFAFLLFLIFSKNDKVLAVLFITVLSCDLLLFEVKTYKNVPQHPNIDKTLLTAFNVSPPEFQPVKTKEPGTIRQQQAQQLIDSSSKGVAYAEVYSFMQFLPCPSKYKAKVDFSPKKRQELDKTTREWIDACDVPRMGLYPAQGLNTANGPAISDNRDTVESQPKVVHFSANEIEVEVNVLNEEHTRLVYMDSYYPTWKVQVNEKPAVLNQAAGMKSVDLNLGMNHVRFYHSSVSTIISYVFSLFYFAVGAFLLGLFFVCCVKEPASGKV